MINSHFSPSTNSPTPPKSSARISSTTTSVMRTSERRVTVLLEDSRQSVFDTDLRGAVAVFLPLSGRDVRFAGVVHDDRDDLWPDLDRKVVAHALDVDQLRAGDGL